MRLIFSLSVTNKKREREREREGERERGERGRERTMLRPGKELKNGTIREYERDEDKNLSPRKKKNIKVVRARDRTTEREMSTE